VSETSSRLLALLSLLQARRHWPGGELAERLGVSGRTVRRDVERLRDLGYPVDAVAGPAGGYRLHAGTAMPPLLLDDDEAVAIAVGLRTAAGASVTGIEETSIRALVKLQQVLPAHLRRRVDALGSATDTLPAHGAKIDSETLTVLAGACRDREQVRFAYRDREGAASRRVADPHSLVNLGRRWYLVAWDRDRDDWRTFRVDRLERPSPAGRRFAARELPGGAGAAEYVAGQRSRAPARHEAVVLVRAPAPALLSSPFRWGGQVEPLDGSSCLYRTSDDSIEWLAVRVGMLDFDFEVREPPELIERLRRLARRYRNAARTG
jgi:predicted DNA-binding transcriptional regulator YafY